MSKRVAFEIEVPDETVVDASTIVFCLGHHNYSVERCVMLTEPGPSTYQPLRSYVVEMGRDG